MFFLRCSCDAALSARARAEWAALSVSQCAAQPTAVASVASAFHSALFTTVVSSLTSAWIVSWAEQAQALLASFAALPWLRARLLDAVLGAEGELTRLRQRSGEDERVRVVRDCYCELMRAEAVGVAEVLDGRPGLLLELLAVEPFLSWRSTASVQSRSRSEDEAQSMLTAHVRGALPAASFAALLTRAISASATSDTAYADVLRGLLGEAKALSALPQSPADLFVRSVLLPLARMGGASSTPSSFSSLLAPLSSALPLTLTRPMQRTLLTFVQCPAVSLPMQHAHAGHVPVEELPAPIDVAARALLAEAERRAASLVQASRGDGDAERWLLLGSLLSSAASIALAAPAVPAWMRERLTLLFSSLPPAPEAWSDGSSAYQDGRAQLMLAVWRTVSAAATPASSPAPPLLPELVRAAAASLSCAVSAFAAVNGRGLPPPPQSFAFLIPVSTFVHSALPALMTWSSAGPLELLPLMSAIHSLLTSPLLVHLSVARYEEALGHAAACLVRFAQSAPDAAALLLTEAVSEASPAAVASAPPLSRLFALLAHSFPALSLRSYELLSLVVLHRAVHSAAEGLSDEPLAVIQRDLREDGVDDGDAGGADASEDDGGRREARRRRRRLHREKVRLQEQVRLLIPAQLQAALEARLQVDDEPTSAAASPSSHPFGGRPVALQLRAYLLSLALTLDVLQRVLPGSGAALSDSNRALLVHFLRADDLLSPFLSELGEHLLVSAPHGLTEAPAIDPWTGVGLSERSLVPATPREGPPPQAGPMLRRSAQLQRLSAELSYVDDAVFFPELSAWLYIRALHALPALSRSWWTNLDRQSGPLVARLTEERFSPLLIRRELSELAQRPTPSASPSSELIVTPHPGSGSVSARYRSGEVEMGLLLRLSPSHPLQPVSVELTDGVRVQAAWLHRWQLSIASALLSSNGGLHDAIRAWLANVDAHFAGVSECLICMAVLHAQQHTTPRMACRTCHNRFHAACLYTWFEKSGHSTCPMCRSAF